MNPDRGPGPDPDPDPDLTIVLVGKAGVGKSASGNTILERTAFESELSFDPVTEKICEERGTVFGEQISVVDTPGILDTKDTEQEIKDFCQKLLQSSRRCLFLVVLRVGRFTKEDEEAVTAAKRVLGPQGLEQSYLLFTGGDALKGRSLKDFIFKNKNKNKGTLPGVVETFAEKYHLFNNEDEDKEQVKELLLKSGHLGTQQPDPPADDSRNRRIILIGRPGAGKSSSGNIILRSKKFKSGGGFNPVSTETVSASATVLGRQVTVVDTPGFTDAVLTPKQLYYQIMKSIEKGRPGPHAFIIVVRIGRIHEADIKLFELLPKLFDSDVCDARKYSMVVFTHEDELEDESIDDLIQKNKHVKKLVSMCAGRFCVFDNKTKKPRQQVRKLLDQIDEMVTANGGKHFTSSMFRMAEDLIREGEGWLDRYWHKIKAAVIFVLVVCAGAGALALTGAGAAGGAGAVAGALAGALALTGAGAAGGAGAGTGALAGTLALTGAGAAGGAGAVAGALAGGGTAAYVYRIFMGSETPQKLLRKKPF